MDWKVLVYLEHGIEVVVAEEDTQLPLFDALLETEQTEKKQTETTKYDDVISHC